jgi:hypothetical protein
MKKPYQRHYQRICWMQAERAGLIIGKSACFSYGFQGINGFVQMTLDGKWRE